MFRLNDFFGKEACSRSRKMSKLLVSNTEVAFSMCVTNSELPVFCGKSRKMEVGATGQTIRLSDVLKFDESLTEMHLFRAELAARTAIRTT